MRDLVSDLFWSKEFRILVLILAILISTGLEVYFHFMRGITTGYTHFYYLFLIPVAILYKRKTVFFGIYLAGMHLGIEALIPGGEINEMLLIRALMFIVVAYIAGYIFEVLEQRQTELIAYLVKKTINMQNRSSMKGDELGEIAPQTVAGTTIRRLKRDENIKGLATALNHPDVEIRYRAAIALGEIGEDAAVAPLARALKDENSGVRWEAAESLGKIGEPALDVLSGALEDEDDDIRWRAAIALGEIHSERSVGPLILALADEDAYVRSRAAGSLSRIGTTAVEPLLLVLNEADEVVGEGVMAALDGMGDRADADMEEILAESDEALRPALVESILKFHQYRNEKTNKENDK